MEIAENYELTRYFYCDAYKLRRGLFQATINENINFCYNFKKVKMGFKICKTKFVKNL